MNPSKRKRRVRLSFWGAVFAIIDLKAEAKRVKHKAGREFLAEAENLERQVMEKYGKRSHSKKKAKGGE